MVSSPPALRHGDLLVDRYVIQAEIGSGARSRVYRAYDTATKTVVAAKVLTGPAANRTDWLDRLGHELRLARHVRHRHVCDVHDLGAADGHRFLTMALARGGALRRSLMSERSWSARVEDARGVIAGLAALHTEGIVHRDVKPENILRMGDGRLVISDFGLAVTAGTESTSGGSGVVGTPTYMAPEVARGELATPTADVYSLGVVLYEILFGCRPAWKEGGSTFRGSGATQTSAEKGARALARLCRLCLHDAPASRPRDAVAVARVFEEIASR